MRQGSHSREEICNHLLPFFESLVDEVHRARQEEATMQSEATIAKRGDGAAELCTTRSGLSERPAVHRLLSRR